MSDILSRIVADKREEVAALKGATPLEEVRDLALAQPVARPFAPALLGERPRGGRGGQGRVNVIAEVKPKSPSKGVFDWHGDGPRQGLAYQAGGAKAISVLTDAKYFGGSVALLRAVRGAVAIPVLQKEFVVEAWQIWNARAMGADAVLLIASVLEGGHLGELVQLAREVGVATLVEVVDGEQMERALAAQAAVVGVNNRDLRDFSIDPDRSLKLLPMCGDETVFITESGIRHRADVERMVAAGVDGFLIGETLMTAADPAAQLAQLRGA